MQLSGPIFHADDWGLSPAVNAGILTLARRGVLRSVACMANGRYLTSQLCELLEFDDIRLYLHFNLTDGEPLTQSKSLMRIGRFHGHRELATKCLLGNIDRAEVANELRAQYEFLRAQRIPVHGLNGHHHVHLLPRIAPVVVKFAAEKHLRLLALSDRQHLWSYLQTLWFKKTQSTPQLEACHYLLARNLRSKSALAKKVADLRGAPLLVHPSAEDDFAQFGVTDKLRTERVDELQNLLGHLDALL